MSATKAPPAPIPLFCQSISPAHPIGIFYGDSPSSHFVPVALLQIGIVLVSVNLVRLLLKPLRQPKIVAEVIGGVIIGPSVLGRSKAFQDFVFPKSGDFAFKTFGIMGFVYFLFVSGIKIDMKLVATSSKKNIWIALSGVMFPLGITYVVGLLGLIPKGIDLSSVPRITTTISITNFPSIFPVLEEMKLLSSEVGRTSLSIGIISQAIGISSLFTFDSMQQQKVGGKSRFGFLISLVFVLALLFAIRKVMLCIVARSQGGNKPIEQGIVIAITAGALCMGFIADMFGMAMGNGAFLFGLVIPDGPPLGSLLVEKTETVVSDVLMPFFFAYIGSLVDITEVSFDLPSLQILVVIVMVACVIKTVVTLLISLLFKMPVRDSLALSLLVNIRGQVELTLFMYWIKKELVQRPHVTVMVLLLTLINGLVTPLIGLLCDPTKPYVMRQRRTIQHTAIGSDLNIMMTIESEDEASRIVSLLEASNPSTATPVSITALCMIEMIGRAVPIFIDHQTEHEVPLQYPVCLAIHKSLALYQESRSDCVKLRSYTTIAPKNTVYQDICEVALLNNAALIILPSDRDDLEASGPSGGHRVGVSSVKMHVLSNAPCSVGILVNKGHFITNPVHDSKASFGAKRHHFALLFLGGADAREALAFAERMISNPSVRMTVFRFMTSDDEGDDKIEKKMDNSMMTRFWVKNETNKRMTYKEVTVQNGAQTAAAIEAINEESFDLWVVGREKGINPVLLSGLSGGLEEPTELGIIGEYVAAATFRSTASVLVIQQQILREKRPSTGCSSSRRLAKCLRFI